jgi:predicted RNA-binding protein (virulence factor B family)
MVELGSINTLQVTRTGPYGTYLDGGELGEVRLLRAGAPADAEPGTELSVFVYVDTDDTVVASAEPPKIVAGECNALKVVALTDHGAFLDWGLNSDLFVPRSEQMGDMAVGSISVVLAMVDDDSQRMIASAKLFRYLPDQSDDEFQDGQPVSLLICQRTDLGYKAVVDGTHLGMLYHNEVFSPLGIGDQREGFVKQVRPDGKLDLTLQQAGAAGRDELESKILEHLRQLNGSSELTDKSAPQAIYNTFGVSKKAYKKALGGLYRNRLIVIGKDRIELATTEE